MYERGEILINNPNAHLYTPLPNQSIEMNPNMMFNPSPYPYVDQYYMNFQNQFQPQIQYLGEIWTLIFVRKYEYNNNVIYIQINSNETVERAFS